MTLEGSDRRRTRLVGGHRLAALLVTLRGWLRLPSLQLSGGISPQVEVSGSPIVASLELLAAFTPVVEVSGPTALPSILLTGDVTPQVEVSGAIALPSLALAGDLAPVVEVSGGPIGPSLALAGAFAPVVEVSGPQTLPSILLTGDVTPLVALSGTLGLPSPQLAGAVSPLVSVTAAALLPSLAISGGISPAVAVSGSLVLPSQRLSGTAFSPIYTHPTVASLVAHWSANIATVSEVPNRMGGAVGPMLQPTAADQPSIITLTGGGKALRFDGSTDDMFATDVAALRSSPKAFWAWHLRTTNNNSGRLYSQWGPSERFDVNYIFGTRFEARVATSPIALAQRNYNIADATMKAGVWLYSSYDGTNGTPGDRHKWFINGVDTGVAGAAGTMPTTLQVGDATEVWLCSQLGIANGAFDIAHFYICNDIPSAAEILAMRDFETPNWS